MIKKIFKRKLFQNYQSGFTLIEMSVVMAITAIMFTLMAYAMISGGKQTKLKDAAKTLQSNIRQAANNAITVSPNKGAVITPAKAWVIEITNGGQSYAIVDYYGNVNPLIRYSDSTMVVTPGNGITFNVLSPDGANVKLVFSSPFAQFTPINGDINSTWAYDSDSKVYTPLGTSISSNIIIQVKDADGKTFNLTIDPTTGESSVN